MKLIIVESPTKAKTFNRLLDKKQYLVVSSMGHIRDLPKKKLGIDLDNNFKPDYVLLDNKQRLVGELIKTANKTKQVILATDPDREGEAIAFHIKEILATKVKRLSFSRIIFHEITKEALLKALKENRSLNMQLFDAQQARRILDRILGYQLSPYLWKRFGKRWLSAGRVQSVALRFIVERELERQRFKSRPTYLVQALFKSTKPLPLAKLSKLRGQNYFQRQLLPLFDGQYDYQTTLIKDRKEKEAQELRLQQESYRIEKIEETTGKRLPLPPFTTSTLQQYGASYLGYTAKRTMSLAQQLYEQGLITYHRTDSNFLSRDFLQQARTYIQKQYGQQYLEATTRVYKTKSKLAQEAHEAIRPTKVKNDLHSNKIKELRSDQLKLYTSIFNRALATQMSAAELLNQKVTIVSTEKDQFVITNQKTIFPGFLILNLPRKTEADLVNKLEVNTKIQLKQLEIEEKQTQPPSRYNEASLIKTLEAKGIGRPSTYAPIVTLIQERQYVEKDGRDLAPSILGIKISEILTIAFSDLMDPAFTARMENELDLIALGKKQWQKIVKDYYLPFKKQLKKAGLDVSKIKVEEPTEKKCPQCGHDLVIKLSRYGKFYACSHFPQCRYTENFLNTLKVSCPKCGSGQVVVRYSRKKRRFYACSNYPNCDFTSLWLPKALKNEAQN